MPKISKDRDFYDVLNLINFAVPDFAYLQLKCRVAEAGQLREALLKAAETRQLDKRKTYDCEHMLFDKNDISRIRTFTQYIGAFDFNRFA